MVDSGSRGEVLAALFLIAYAGLAVPVLAIGVGVAVLPDQVALLVFSAIILVLVNIAGLALGPGRKVPRVGRGCCCCR